MRRTGSAGFSLFEAMIVASIGMIITVASIPSVVTGISNMRLRSSLTSLAGVLQNCRVLAVKQNQHMTTHFSPQPFGIVAFVKRSTESPDLETHDSQVELQAPVSRVTAPSGLGAPPPLDNAVLGFTPEIGVPSFNPTGLPCVYSGGSCSNHGFAYYFHDSRPAPQTGWAALSISPAGRLKKWYWNGATWTD